ncbi:MAG: response regulator [Candidatus Omnitrophica bacterium]|nr:response regulator [Candidatus Omnitrophota bacterium]
MERTKRRWAALSWGIVWVTGILQAGQAWASPHVDSGSNGSAWIPGASSAALFSPRTGIELVLAVVILVLFSVSRRKCQMTGRLLEETKTKGKALESLQADLTIERDNLQSLFDASPVAFVLIDRDGKFKGVNHAAAELFHRSEADLIGKRPGEGFGCIHHWDQWRGCGHGVHCGACLTRHAIETVFADGIAIEKIQNHERFIIDGVEEELWLELSANPIKVGAEDCVLMTLTDITDYKRIEIELAAARDRANAAAETKSHILANMSHELRTPLNGVLGMCNLLHQTDLTEEQESYCNIIDSSGQSLLSLVDSILDYTNIHTGRIRLENIVFDLERILDETVEILLPWAIQKRIHLSYFIDPDLPLGVEGDPGRIRQILTNLIQNAIKFTDTGGTVFLRVDRIGINEDTVEIGFAVQDNGVGIPEGRLKSIFESFTQADASTTRKHGGVGLGLAVCQEICRLMGGRIEVESREGEGSRFSFRLNLKISSDASIENRSVADWPMPDLVIHHGLESPHLGVIGAYMEKWGCPFEVTEDAKDLERILLAPEIRGCRELIILVSLDEIGDGDLELIRRLRNGGEGGARRVVALHPSFPMEGVEVPSSNEYHASLALPMRRKDLRAVLSDDGLSSASSNSRRSHSNGHGMRSSANHGTESGLRILLAEDNPINCKAAKKMLERLGHEVVCHYNGLAAVEGARNQTYDVILMDCRMPELDGFEAARRIRSLEGPNTETPIIALTASVSHETRDECFEAGMTDYLVKPVSLESLIVALTPLVERKRGSVHV